MNGVLRTIFRTALPHCPRNLASRRFDCKDTLAQYYGPLQLHSRFYASKSKSNNQKRKSGVDESDDDKKRSRKENASGITDFVPGSQTALAGEAQEEYTKMKERMKMTVDWFKREVANMEGRGSGRVTPDILKPVRVTLPGARGEPVSLLDIATVGVRDGTTLVVTVFEDANLKHVEMAIYAAKIPHVVPQRTDNRTIKIPMPKPTVDARLELVKQASKQAEDSRVQLRRIEQTGAKKGKYGKHSREIEEFHKLLQQEIKEIDTILSGMKKTMGVK